MCEIPFRPSREDGEAYLRELEAGQALLAELSSRLELPGKLEWPWPPLDMLPAIRANARNVNNLRARCEYGEDNLG